MLSTCSNDLKYITDENPDRRHTDMSETTSSLVSYAYLGLLSVRLEVLSLFSSPRSSFSCFLHIVSVLWLYFFTLSPLGIPIFLSLQLLPLHSFYQWILSLKLHPHIPLPVRYMSIIQPDGSKIQPTFSPPSLIFTYTWIPLSLSQLPAQYLWNHFDCSLSNLEEKFSML